MGPGGVQPVGTLALCAANLAVIFPLHALWPSGAREDIPPPVAPLAELLADPCVSVHFTTRQDLECVCCYYYYLCTPATIHNSGALA